METYILQIKGDRKEIPSYRVRILFDLAASCVYDRDNPWISNVQVVAVQHSAIFKFSKRTVLEESPLR